jgi:DNA-binding transcriptional regulator YiaG
VKPVRLDRYETTLAHDGREYQLLVPDLDAYRCDSCGEITLDDAGDERVTEALYDAAKLLHPRQIRSERERLGYMSKDFADLLGVSPSTLSRWENGYQIQQRSMDRAMRQHFAVPAAREYAVMLRNGDAAAFEVPCRVYDWVAGLSSSTLNQRSGIVKSYSPSLSQISTEYFKRLIGRSDDLRATTRSVSTPVPPKKPDPRMAA